MSSPTSDPTLSNDSVDGAVSTKWTPAWLRLLNTNPDHGDIPGDTRQIARFIPIDPKAAAAELRHRQFKGHPHFNGQFKDQYKGGDFGSRQDGSPLTQFILIEDVQSTADYFPGGQYHQIMCLGSLLEWAYDDGNCVMGRGKFKFLLRYGNSVDVDIALTFVRDKELNAFCISASRYCQVYKQLEGGVAWNGKLTSPANPAPRTVLELGMTFANGYDGQLFVEVEYIGDSSTLGESLEPLGLEVMGQLFLDLAGNCGHIKVAASVKAATASANPKMVGYVIELYDHNLADHIVDFLKDFTNGHKFKDFVFKVMHYSPDVFGGTKITSLEADPYQEARGRFGEPKNRFGAIGDGRILHVQQRAYCSSRVRKDWANSALEHFTFNIEGKSASNTVNWDAVVNGEDTRTTFMLRNIPSELNFATLKAFIDTFLKCKYDFLYLRMDFSTKKNLGYAFINLGKPEHILPFLHCCAGARWPITGNTKRVEVSYATVQNIETLIHKFRNSAVMLEDDDCKPHDEYPMRAGEERPFPGPDNNQKQMRSEQNALNYGLYAPGHHHRRSGFDRGQFDRGHPVYGSPYDEDNLYERPELMQRDNICRSLKVIESRFRHGPAQVRADSGPPHHLFK